MRSAILLVFAAMTVGVGEVIGGAAVFGQTRELIEGAHETLRVKRDRVQSITEDGWRDIADVTVYCLECHGEGEISDAPGAGGATAPKASHEVGGLGRSHPVDVEYPPSRPGYRPIASLDERLVLVGGRLTCLTCHSAAPDRSLVFPTNEGRLCVACHDM